MWHRALFLTTVGYDLASGMCCWDVVAALKNRCVDRESPTIINLTLPTFVPIHPKESDKSWTEVLSLCVWMFGVCLPSCGVVCKAFVCLLMFLYACVGCVTVLCLKVNWSACQLSQSNLCFAFWKLFWCSSRVLPCFNVPAWMHMLSFAFPYILPCPASFLVLCICSTS